MPYREEIPKTYKELIHNHYQYIQVSGWIAQLDYLLSYCIAMPIIGWILKKNFNLFCITLMRYRSNNQYHAFFSLLFEKLTNEFFRNQHAMHWWYLMRLG